jgi:hypothetical protein
MRRPLTLVLAVFVSAFTSGMAQISISDGSNAEGPNPDAVFEISSRSQGVLLPRLALRATDDPAPMRRFTAGMIVYNTATTEGDAAVRPGLYVCDGSQWVPASGGVIAPKEEPPSNEHANTRLRGIYRPPMECRTFDIEVGTDIPENAVVLLTLEHAGENPTCLAIREIDRTRNVLSVTSSSLLPTFARIHWMIIP